MLPDPNDPAELPAPPIPSTTGYTLHLFFTAETFAEAARLLQAASALVTDRQLPTAQLRQADLTPIEPN